MDKWMKVWRIEDLMDGQWMEVGWMDWWLGEWIDRKTID